tara:strand:- start:991 stop:1332 length:342 start_codon:yes stop_codon:yes gene_type:complete
MQLTIYGKQLDVGDALRGDIEEQWQAVVGKYFEKPTDGHVTMSKKGADIRAEMETVIKKLMPGDAFVRMDLANLPALMFRNISHGGINMIYRRADGNYRVGRSARIARWPSLG